MKRSAQRECDSDSDEEEYNEASHAKMLAEIQEITKKPKRRAGNKLRCISQNSTGVDQSVLVSLGKNTAAPLYKLEAPISKQEGQRLTRHRDYQVVAEEVNKWEKLVDNQRTARQLSFPLKNNNVSIIDGRERFKPRMKTDLEKEMYELLSGADMLKPTEESAEAKQQREAMSLEEIQERNAESWRLRALKMKVGKRAHLRNKTKSKKFRKVLKKDRLKQEASDIKSLQKVDPDKAMKKLQELDDIRIEERMTLKHKKSKWAASLQTRAKTDKNALAALRENARLHEELVTKYKKQKEDEDEEKLQNGEDDDDDDDSSSDAEDMEVEENSKVAPSLETQSYKKMKEYWSEYSKEQEVKVAELLQERRRLRATGDVTTQEVRAMEQADQIVNDKLTEIKRQNKERKKNKGNNTNDNTDRPTITEYECNFSSMSRPEEPMMEVSERLVTLQDCDQVQADTDRQFSADVLKLSTTDENKKPPLSSTGIIDNKSNLLEATKLPSFDKDLGDLFGSGSDNDDDLFNEDDCALESFTVAKRAAEEAERIKDECFALAGWGDWTGPDIKISERKIKKFTVKAPKKAPSKFDKTNVIYNEKADMHQNIRNRMVTELPYPFMRVSDYEASIRGPVGRTFVPETAHRKLTMAPLVTKLGTVIKPMEQSQLLIQPAIREAVDKKMQLRGQLPSHNNNNNKKRVKGLNKIILPLSRSDTKIKKFSRKTNVARINK